MRPKRSGPPPTAPDAPTGLTATTFSGSRIDLSWTAPANNGGSPITGYKIERESPSGGGFTTIVANTGSTSTAYSNTVLNPVTEYNYRVSAINAKGTSDPSDTASDTTDANAPDAPASLSVATIGPSRNDLTWTVPASDGGSAVTGYKIERESPSGGGWSTLVADTGTTDLTYSDTGLSTSTEYSYRVSAINAIGTGVPSTTDTKTTAAHPTWRATTDSTLFAGALDIASGGSPAWPADGSFCAFNKSSLTEGDQSATLATVDVGWSVRLQRPNGGAYIVHTVGSVSDGGAYVIFGGLTIVDDGGLTYVLGDVLEAIFTAP